MSSDMPKGFPAELTIIIVSWNVKELLRECLRSIYEQTRTVKFEIVVVDNASSDGSGAMLAREFTQVRLIACSKNVGFAAGNNIGFQHAHGRYIGLLNPDTVLLNDVFGPLVSRLERSSSVGLVGPKLLSPDGSVQYPCARRFATLGSEIRALTGLGLRREGVRVTSTALPPSAYEVSRTVECISGACMVLRREILAGDRIFDEVFFMYGEDIDLCFETAVKGWQTYYVHDALVRHYSGASSSRDTSAALLYALHARYYFLTKRYGRQAGRIFRWLTFLISAAKLIVAQLLRLYPPLRRDPITVRRGSRYRLMLGYALRGFELPYSNRPECR